MSKCLQGNRNDFLEYMRGENYKAIYNWMLPSHLPGPAWQIRRVRDYWRVCLILQQANRYSYVTIFIEVVGYGEKSLSFKSSEFKVMFFHL